jgi:hypothetical protein
MIFVFFSVVSNETYVIIIQQLAVNKVLQTESLDGIISYSF